MWRRLLGYLRGPRSWRLAPLASILLLAAFESFFDFPNRPLRRLAVTAILLVVVTFAVIKSFKSGRVDDAEAGEELKDLIVEILLAIGLAACLIVLGSESVSLGFHPAASPQESQEVFSSKQLVKIIGMAFLIYLLGIIRKSGVMLAEAGTQLKSAENIAKETKNAISLALETLNHAHFAGAAASAFRLQRDWLEEEGKPDGDLAKTLTAGLSPLRAWVRKGSDFKGEDLLFCRRAWWQVMRAYHHEEAFDVGRMEIATNVRNYAYVLLAAARELQKMSTSNEKKRVIVVNVTPFAPKDFYNFPNGRAGDRFYHEAEFFGTYRRALSWLFTLPQVVPHRLFLLKGTADQNQTPTAYGWETDNLYKVSLDLGRYYFIPTPLGWSRHSDVSTSSQADLPLIDKLRPCFEQKADRLNPEKRLPVAVRRILWQPAYVALRAAVSEARVSNAEVGSNGCIGHGPAEAWLSRIREKWAGDPAEFNEVASCRTEDPLVAIQKTTRESWKTLIDKQSRSSYYGQEQAAWDRLVQAIGKGLAMVDDETVRLSSLIRATAVPQTSASKA